MISRVSPEIQAHIERDLFARSLGIALVELAPGFAKCELTVRDSMLNIHGSAHGGAIFALADAAFAAASNSYGLTTVALSMTINYLEPVAAGTRLTAEAKEESATARVALYHLQVCDEHGELIASLHATAFRKSEWFVEKTGQF